MLESNLQVVFDRVVNHLLTQNKRSVSKFEYGIDNAYHSDEGLKCAIGCLINDEVYKSDIEGHSIDEVEVIYSLVNSGIKTDRKIIRLLQELQRIHDDVYIAQWRYSLKKVASKFRLNFNA